jgi:hypothetical protein
MRRTPIEAQRTACSCIRKAVLQCVEMSALDRDDQHRYRSVRRQRIDHFENVAGESISHC